jgi:hypothetical protein
MNAMKTLIAVLALAGLSLVAVADTTANPVEACLLAATTVEQQKECCKANKGVCGCRAGKIVCCDKTFSPDCTC